MYDEILTVEEVSEILYIGRNTTYDLLRKGELPGFRIGRVWKIPRQALESYITSKCSV